MTGGPGQQKPVLREIWGSSSRIRPCVAMPEQCLLSALLNSEAVLSLLGWNLPPGDGTMLTRGVRTVTAHAVALLSQAIITHARSAVTGLYATCAQ
jgi:hypothetical protein